MSFFRCIMLPQKLLELSWDVSPHPFTRPSDCHLSRSLRNSLGGINFASLGDGEKSLGKFPRTRKAQGCYERRIMKLRGSWREIVEQRTAHILMIKISFNENTMHRTFVWKIRALICRLGIEGAVVASHDDHASHRDKRIYPGWAVEYCRGAETSSAFVQIERSPIRS